MVGAEIVVGYLIAWAVRKVKLVGRRLDGEVDDTLNASLDRLHEVVQKKLGNDAALAELEQEATDAGEVSDLTRQRVELAIRAAELKDAAFVRLLEDALAELTSHRGASNALAVGERSTAVGGNAEISAKNSSAAALTMGDVTLSPPKPGEHRD